MEENPQIVEKTEMRSSKGNNEYVGHKAVWINDFWGLWKNKKGNVTSHEFKKKSFQFSGEIDLLFTLYFVCVPCDSKEYFLWINFWQLKKWNIFTNGTSSMWKTDCFMLKLF